MPETSTKRPVSESESGGAAPSASPPTVVIEGVTKRLGDHDVLSSLDLEVGKGEFLSLLGPSGVGKSTILNVIAGFLPIESGRVLLAGRDVTDMPPHKRNLGFIFQEYALFPHMSVGQNVRFPLDMRGIKGKEAADRVADALAVVGLGHVAERRPQALSGGQRQRVAIARSMVFRPEVLLMDEPMSSLDRQLRDDMTIETRRLQRELGVTVVYVTHDQTEALSLSDRVGILRDGRIEQIGSPKEVHDRPVSTYAARLCGPINTEEVTTVEHDGAGSPCTVRIGETVIRARPPVDANASILGVRPYLIELQHEPAPAPMNSLQGAVTGLSMVGNGVRYDVDIGSSKPWQVLAGRPFEGIQVGDAAHLVWAPADAALLVE